MIAKTILFGFLITAMILPFSGMNFVDMQEAFGMQHTMMKNMHFDNEAFTEITEIESTMVVRHNKAMSFNPI